MKGDKVRKLRDKWSQLDKSKKKAAFKAANREMKELMAQHWMFKARDKQLPPVDNNWTVWLILSGRGFGKTWCGSNNVIQYAYDNPGCRIALVGSTSGDVRDIMIDGESGILNQSPPWFKPQYEPSKKRITWPNGSQASCFSAEEPERLRGPQFHLAWCDEMCAWSRVQETWDMLSFCMRLGDKPRYIITTTPKPLQILKDLDKRDDVVTVGGSTYENAGNLAPSYLNEMRTRYEGTRLGQQELHGLTMWDNPNALFREEDIKRTEGFDINSMRRIVVAIDPAVTTNKHSDETGIIIAGKGQDGNLYVLDDISGKYSPREWARRAISAFNKYKADRIIYESNQGGDLVAETIRTEWASAPIKSIRASKGKFSRAEPIAALYEQGRVYHTRRFTLLESQMCDFDPNTTKKSPDRMDALVYALQELNTVGRISIH